MFWGKIERQQRTYGEADIVGIRYPGSRIQAQNGLVLPVGKCYGVFPETCAAERGVGWK
jgi:hypothetical protein